MGLLESLLHSYDYAESIGMVDDHSRSPVLLPLYHTAMDSNGKNCICAYLRKNGELFKAEFIPEGETIIFPITEKSIARSGSKPPPHPLVDKLNYLAFYNEVYHTMYKEEFEQWYHYEKAQGGNAFLEAIHQFYQNQNWVHDLIENLFEGISYEYQAPQVTYEVADNKGKIKSKTIDLSTVFLTFSVVDLEKDKEVSVTENIELHKAYICYVENLHTEKKICNITGKELYCTLNHRGVIRQAKLISSKRSENYRGRFKKREDIVIIGYETSQKIHLMLKYLLENKNSHIMLGESTYLVNWFSDDISNASGFNPTLSVRHELEDSLLEEDWDSDDDMEKTKPAPVTELSKKIGLSFLKGRREFSDHAQYYLLLLSHFDFNDGRVSINHFCSIPVSELKERLDRWQDRYQWEFYSPQLKKTQWGTPSIYQIVNTAYGVERDGQLVVDKDTFKEDQLQKTIAAMMDGDSLPQGIIKMLKNNIRNRQRYDKTWNGVLYVTKAVLYDEERERVKEMLDRSCNDRSYLFGRLLAIYQFIEEATFAKEEERLTNAEKVWAAYMSHPATTMNLLENKTSVYINKLKVQKPGLKVRCEKEKADVIARLDQHYLSQEKGKELLNKPLDHLFIFGYYAEQQALYTKSEKKENKEDEQ